MIEQKEKKKKIVSRNKKRGKETEKRALKQLEQLGFKVFRQGIFGKEDLLAFNNNIVFSCEVKNRKQFSFLKWFEQAESNAKEGQIPIVLCSKYHSKKFFVIIGLEHFIKLIKGENK